MAAAWPTNIKTKRARPRAKAKESPTIRSVVQPRRPDGLLSLDVRASALDYLAPASNGRMVTLRSRSTPHIRSRGIALRELVERVVHDRPDIATDDSMAPKQERRRKPHGYWNRLSNLEAELLIANSQLGYTGRRAIPRLDDLKRIGRGDLVAALGKHGGVKQVSEALRWPRVRSLGQRVQNSVRSIRSKVARRPADYWANVSRVHTEMGAFISEFGSRGIMPTRKQLYAFGRADLANAAERHGGLLEIARQMGVHGRKDSRRRGYWRDFSRVREEVIKFSEEYCNGVMPTADELSGKGLSCLVNAIATHGGFPTVAEKCGLKARNAKRQGAPNLWDEARVRKEYLSFLMTYYPHLARERTMVGERQLRQHGRNDLSYAIGKFGGFAKLGGELNLKKRSFRARLPAAEEDSTV